jgi:signal transduction histidine kinase
VIAAANLTYLIGIALPSVAVWLLRRHEPERPRTYRARVWSLRLGLVAAVIWLTSTILGFEQFGLPIVILGLALAFSGSLAYVWRVYFDHRDAGTSMPRRSLHIKLSGALLIVLVLNAVGYAVAINSLNSSDTQLISLLKDIFVAVGLLTISVGLILPGMIAHTADKVVNAATSLSEGALADLSHAMEAFSSGELESANFAFHATPLQVRSHDEFGEMAQSFNDMQRSVERVHSSLSTAVADALTQRNNLEEVVRQRTGELQDAYERLKFSQEQRYDILSRLKVYTDLMEDRSSDPGDVSRLSMDIAAALGPVMRADAAIVHLADVDGTLSDRALAWRSSHIGPLDDEGPTRETMMSPEFLDLEHDVVRARVTRSFHDPTGDARHFLWGHDVGENTGFDVLISPFYSHAGVLIGLICLARNGVERRWGDTSIVEFVAADLGRGVMSARLFHDQRRLVHQLQTLDRTRDEMLSTFSHELRTPLASIVAYAELLAEDPLMTAQDTHMIAIIERNAHRLARLVEDILSLSNFNADIMNSTLELIALDPIVRSVYDALAPTVTKELDLHIELDAPGALIMGDVAQIERLCINLLTNAVKFTPDGGRVGLSTALVGTEVVVRVSDTGIGIDPDDVDLVFDRFYRGANAVEDAIAGTGLGLSIVDAVVQHHGAQITVCANSPRGTVFEVRFPLVAHGVEHPASTSGETL